MVVSNRQLPEELVELIGWRVLAAGDLLDYTSASPLEPHHRHPARPRHPRRALPPAPVDAAARGPPPPRRLRALPSTSPPGVLLLMHRDHHATDIRLLHPFTVVIALDRRWTLSPWELPSLLASTVSFQGNLYTVSPSYAETNTLRIRQIDQSPPNSDSLQPPRMIIGFNGTSSAQLVVYRVADLISAEELFR